MKKAVIVFSGGLDSTICLTHAINEGFEQAQKIIYYYNIKAYKVFDTLFLKEIGNSYFLCRKNESKDRTCGICENHIKI